MNTDDSIKRTKSLSRPFLPQEERIGVMSGLACVNYVFLYDENLPSNSILRLKPNIYTKGKDYNPDNLENMPEAEIVRSYGGRVEIVKSESEISTSKILSSIFKSFKNKD